MTYRGDGVYHSVIFLYEMKCRFSCHHSSQTRIWCQSIITIYLHKTNEYQNPTQRMIKRHVTLKFRMWHTNCHNLNHSGIAITYWKSVTPQHHCLLIVQILLAQTSLDTQTRVCSQLRVTGFTTFTTDLVKTVYKSITVLHTKISIRRYVNFRFGDISSKPNLWHLKTAKCRSQN